MTSDSESHTESNYNQGLKNKSKSRDWRTYQLYYDEIHGTSMFDQYGIVTYNTEIFIHAHNTGHNVKHTSIVGFTISQIHYLISQQFLYTWFLYDWLNSDELSSQTTVNFSELEQKILNDPEHVKFLKEIQTDEGTCEWSYNGFEYDADENIVYQMIDH